MYRNSKTYGRTFRERKRRKLDKSIRNSKTNKSDSSTFKEERVYHELQRWMGIGGFKFTKKLKPSNFKETGRGLMAKEVVHPGDIIISLPEKFLITPQTVKSTYLGQYLKRYCPYATGSEILSIFLLCEKIRGKASPWFPYIVTLPLSYTIPAYNEEIVYSLPSSLKFSFLEHLKTIKNSFEKLSLVLTALEQIFPEFHGELHFKSYIWAWCGVNSRCVYMECYREECAGSSCTFHLALAPFLDLLNHNSSVKVKAGFNKQSNCYEIISESLFKKYSQVFINYGNHSNRKLFLEYGFVLKDNINDVIPISVGEVLEVHRKVNKCNSMANLQTLIQQNSFLSDNLGFCTKGMTWNLDVLLKIMSLDCSARHWMMVMDHGFKLNENENLRYMKLVRETVLWSLQEYEYVSLLKYEEHNNTVDLESLGYLSVVNELCSMEKNILLKILEALKKYRIS